MMAELRDKGAIPLARPDSKPCGALDPATGNLVAAFLDLNAHEAVCWHQVAGWLPKVSYPNVYLVGWTGFIHDNRFKVIGRTWDEDQPGEAAPGHHFVILDLGALPRQEVP